MLLENTETFIKLIALRRTKSESKTVLKDLRFTIEQTIFVLKCTAGMKGREKLGVKTRQNCRQHSVFGK